MEDREQQRIIKRRQPLNDRQKLVMLAVLVRRAEAFEIAKEQLEPEKFSDLEREYRLTWRTVLDFYEEYEELPAKDELLAELQARLADDPEVLEDDEIERLDGLVADIYGIPRKSTKTAVGLSYLQRFLHDRLAENLRDLFQVTSATPDELGEHLERAVEQTHRIDTLKDSPIDLPFPDDWDAEAPVVKTPTRFNWLDEFLAGGDANGEVIAYAAPFGTCKTLLAVQLSTRAARQFAIEFDRDKRTGEPILKLSYHITYEEPMRMLRVRALSYIGMIQRTALETGQLADLSAPGRPKEYEKKMFRFSSEVLQCEQGRRENASRWLNFNWRVIDFTGSHAGREHLGSGGVPEMVQAVRRDLSRMSKKTGFRCEAGKIIVDYAGIACKKMLEAKGIQQSQELRQALGMFPAQCKLTLAERFKCPVHVFAQLSGSAAGLAPGVVCKRTDTAENKLLLENADFGITFGNITGDGLTVASLQKARRGKAPQNIVVKVNGLMCRLEDTRDEWVLYERGKRIVSRDELSRINAGTSGGPLFRNGQPVRKLNLKAQRDAMAE
jgi:hypothetical protein